MIFIDDPLSKEFKDSIAWIKSRSILALDTETNGLDPFINRVLLLQIGDRDTQYVYDVFRVKDKINEVFDALNKPNLYKVIHNAQFDYKMIKGSFGVSLNNMICTMVAEKLLTKGKNVSAALKAVSKKYVNYDMDKVEQKSFINMRYGDKFTKLQLKYAGTDVVYLIDIWEKQKALIKDKKFQDLTKMEFEVLPVISDMSMNGIYINRSLWLELEEKAIESMLVMKKDLEDFFADYTTKDDGTMLFSGDRIYINFDSHAQVKKAFTEHLGISLESTDAKYLDTIKDVHPAISMLVKYRQYQKLISTYGSNFLSNINLLTGRIHSSFRQVDTETGRMSSSDPNLQNIPRSQAYRTPFQVQDPANYRMISADFSGQELRLLAQISGEEKFINAIKEGKDIHSYSASLLYGIPYEDFLEYDKDGNIVMDGDEPKIKKEMKAKYRNPCKTITFG